MTTHRLGRRCTSRTIPLRPLHHARHANPEQRRRCPARATARHRTHNTIPKILRIGSRHRCWPPTPPSILKQKTPPLGNPLIDSAKPDPAILSGSIAGIDEVVGAFLGGEAV